MVMGGPLLFNLWHAGPASVVKDRIAAVRFISNPAGLLEIVIDPTDDQTVVKPTYVTEQVSRNLEDQDQPVTTGSIKRNVTGKDKFILIALETLVDEGYAAPAEGPRKGANYYQSVDPTGNEDEDGTHARGRSSRAGPRLRAVPSSSRCP